MRKTLLLVCTFALFLGGNSVKAALTWADEFNSISGWSYQIGPITSNNELEYYTNSSANSFISNGCLVIKAQAQSMGGYAYTSARMSKGSFLYGFFEGRMTIPQKMGSWPAFWMLGTNIGSAGWPACGEIDIMEQVNTGTDIHSSLHWYNGGQRDWTAIAYIGSPTSFNLYQCNWNMYGFKFYVNGVQIGSWVGSASTNGMNDNGMGAFRKNQFILLNLAVGGFWPGYNIQGLPWYMNVDYVRQYTAAAKKSAGPDILEPEPTFNEDGSFAGFSNEREVLSDTPTEVASTKMYPNPLASEGTLNIVVSNYNASAYVNVAIYDMKGSLVVNKTENSGVVSFNPGLKAGLYTVKVTNGTNETINKLVVK